MLFHNIPAVQLVPQHTVIKIRRILHHMCCELFSGEHALLFDVSLGGQTLSHHAVKVRNDHVTAVLLRCPHEQSGGIRCDPVVTVEELQIFSPGTVKRPVSAVGDSGVLLLDHNDSGILVSVLFTNIAGSIRTAIIDQQQFIIRIFLVQNAVDTAS